MKEAVSSYVLNGPHRSPAKTQNAEKKPEKGAVASFNPKIYRLSYALTGKQRVRDDLPPSNVPVAPDPTESVSTALDTRSNPKGMVYFLGRRTPD